MADDLGKLGHFRQKGDWHISSIFVVNPPILICCIFRLLESHVKRAEGVEDKSAEVTEIRNELLKAEEVTVEAAQIDIAIVQEGLSPSRGQFTFH